MAIITFLLPFFLYSEPKIELFLRHCYYSSNSSHARRFPWFSKEACFSNLVNTTDERVNITILLDTFYEGHEKHFITEQGYPLVEIKGGRAKASFLNSVEYIATLPLDPETIVYLVEDDYLHRPGWVDILLEGFSLPTVFYVTLFDHGDKYYGYPNLTSKIFHTEHCHWRTTPSTCDTDALKFKTLLQDLPTLRRDLGDHQRFCVLGSQGRGLISALPGWATHVDNEINLSPCTDWKEACKICR